MIEIERKAKTLTISAVLVLAVLSGIALMAFVNANGETNDMTTTNGTWAYNGQHCNNTGPPFGRRGCRGERGGYMSVTVSQEFKDNVIGIAQNDSDVQTLLNEGYSITNVRPLISTTVEADGTVTMKATTAIVTLLKDTTGRASVWVNVEQAKVTRIEILTRTVIEKP